MPTIQGESNEFVDVPFDAVVRANIPGEEIVTLSGATLASFKVMGNGMGFDVHFTVPLQEAEKLPSLTLVLQRLCDIRVTRFSRSQRARADVWEGTDD